MSKASRLLWLQFIATTRYFGTPFLLLLVIVTIGYWFREKYHFDKTRLRFAVLLFSSFLLSVIFRRTSIDWLDLTTNVVLVLTALAGSILLRRSRLHSNPYWIILVNTLVVVYILGLAVLGIDLLEGIRYITSGGSYHQLFWFLFILNSLVIIPLSNISEIQSNHRVLFLIALSFAIASILLRGRSGILISIFLLFAVLINTLNWKWSLLIVLSLLIFLSLIEFDSLLKILSSDLSERGFQISVRQSIWACYFPNMNMIDIIFGFDKKEIASECLRSIGWYSKGDSRIMTESSFLSLISSTGILGLLLLIFTILRSIVLSYNYRLHAVVFIALLFRIFSGDFLFFGISDFFIWTLMFNYRE